jgi:hypothetical protein
VIDTQVQHRINTKEGEWRPCQNVVLSDGVLHCTLALDRKYVLTEAYRDDLHISFSNIETDDDLRAFVHAWGPLYLTDEQRRRGTASFPLGPFRTFQRWLRALLNLLAAFKRAEGERAALQEFIEAEFEYDRNSPVPALLPQEPPLLAGLRCQFGISGDLVDWTQGAGLRAVRAATDFLVSCTPVGTPRAGLTCLRKPNRRQIEATWAVSSLEDALRWMVWYDEYTKHSLVCCQECRKVFRAETAHARKYCSHECAHRATAREWQRRKRGKGKKAKNRTQA